MTSAAIVQARMGSSRLPGKVMERLAGRTVLHHVLDRCRAIPGVEVVVCAVPDEPASAPLLAVAAECGSQVFRGSESDVLSRYLGAARSVGANEVVRVTADCPLIDPGVCGDIISARRREDADYAANNLVRSFPHGLDAEAFTIAALEKADANAVEANDREHVTPWIRRATEFKRVNVPSGNDALKEHRWTLDYPADLDFVRAVFAALPEGSPGYMNEVLEILTSRPDIAAINQMYRIST